MMTAGLSPSLKTHFHMRLCGTLHEARLWKVGPESRLEGGR